MKHGALLKYNPFVKNWIRKNRRNAVATILQRQVFCWEEVEVSSDLDRLRRVLEALPDEDLVRVLEHRRGKGRDDFPVRACFNAVIAGIVFQRPKPAVSTEWSPGTPRLPHEPEVLHGSSYTRFLRCS